MRARVLLFFVVNILVVGVLVRSVWPLLALLVLTGSHDQILRAELPAPDSHALDAIPTRIPKIIHQTYITTGVPSPTNGSYIDHSIPDVWKEAQESCKTLHDDYEYKLWTDSNSRSFIEKEYPWFLDTWDGYRFPIERADAIRYFALYHFGGTYIDLDNGCRRRLDPLLTYSAWVRKSSPTGIGNDVLGTVPEHPFFRQLIEHLQAYDHSWLSPYITIMGSTGPLYASLIWRAYNLKVRKGDEKIRVLFPDEYMSENWSFFTHHVGNSWHRWDAETIFWMSRHWIGLTIAGFVAAGFVFAGMWLMTDKVYLSSNNRSYSNCFGRILLWRRHSGKNYIRLTERVEV